MPGVELLGSEKNKREYNDCLCPNARRSVGALEPSEISCRNTAALALTIVRDGVITGEGPTTKGRIHFSRALDADDAAWCARILTRPRSSISRSAVPKPKRCSRSTTPPPSAATWTVRRFAGQGGRASCRLRVRSAGAVARRSAVAGHRDRKLGATRAVGVDTEVLEWIASQMRGKHRSNRTLMRMVATSSAPRRCRFHSCRTCSTSGCKFSLLGLISGGGVIPRRFLFAVHLQYSRFRTYWPAWKFAH